MYKTGMHSDFIIVCGQREYRVHKTVLLAQSDVLYEMATNERFKVLHPSITYGSTTDTDFNMQECQAGRLDLAADDPDCVAAMVHWLYHLDYIPPETVADAVFHVRMAILANK